MHRAQLVRYNLGNLQTARVRTNIDGGKSRHVFRMISGAGIQSLGQDTRAGPLAAVLKSSRF
jgi:hypothetical protein